MFVEIEECNTPMDVEEVTNTKMQESYASDDVKLLDFDKTFVFHSNGEVPATIALFTTPKSEVTGTYMWESTLVNQMKLKAELNGVKSRLIDQRGQLEVWHMHTKFTNPAQDVVCYLKFKRRCFELPTQAWLKFYELAPDMTKFLEEGKCGKFHSLHLCEAPGAFVAALNHYLKLYFRQIEWDWTANTLNPFYEGNKSSEVVSEDSFILQTMEHWDFGPDHTGDISNLEYPLHLANVTRDKNVMLVTADGSFNCGYYPEEQESLVVYLHYKETLVALNILQQGGNFLLKIFTTFELETICLLYLLKSLFNSMSIKKPFTSKEGNSETYVVCLGYKGINLARPFLEILSKFGDKHFKKYSMFSPAQIGGEFMKEIEKCSNYFSSLQMRVIDRNITLFPTPQASEMFQQIKNMRKMLCQEFVQFYDLKQLPSNKFYMTNPKIKIPKKLKCVYYGDLPAWEYLKLDDSLLFSRLRDDFLEYSGRFEFSANVGAMRYDLDYECSPIMEEIYGKPLEEIHCSHFCCKTFLAIRELVRKRFENGIPRQQQNYCSEEGVCDVADCYNTKDVVNNYNDRREKAFLKIYEKVKDLDEGRGTFNAIVGYETLTIFEANVLFVLGKLFRQTVFKIPNRFEFVGGIRSNNGWMEVLDAVAKSVKRIGNEERSILSFLPIRYVTGYNNKFYLWLVEVNSYALKSELAAFFKCQEK